MNLTGVESIGNLYRISKVFEKAKNAEKLVIGYIGGSITQGSLASTSKTCYAYLSFKWWEETFPQTKFQYVNAGIGATTSQYGVARVNDDLLKLKPDIVFVEYSANDENTDFFKETYEGLIRKILFSESKPAIITLNNMEYSNMVSAKDIHNNVARAYSLPILSLKEVFFKKIKENAADITDYLPDYLHPNDEGHLALAQAIKELLVELKNQTQDNEITKYSLLTVAPITKNRFERLVRLDNRNTKPVLQGFIKDERKQNGCSDIFKNGWMASKKGNSMNIRFKGKYCLVCYRKTIKHPAPIAKISIDDGKIEMCLDANFDENWGDCLGVETLNETLEEGEHILNIEIIKETEIEFYLEALLVES